jgi:hypothetical protein
VALFMVPTLAFGLIVLVAMGFRALLSLVG